MNFVCPLVDRKYVLGNIYSNDIHVIQTKLYDKCLQDLTMYNLEVDNEEEAEKGGWFLHYCFPSDIKCMLDKLVIDSPSSCDPTPCYRLLSCVVINPGEKYDDRL